MNRKLLDSVESLLVTNPSNIRYLTGFVGVDKRDAYCLLTPNQLFLFTNSLYLESARNLKSQIPITKHTEITLIEISREYPLTKQLAKVVKQEKIIKLGFEETDLTVAEFNKLTKELNGATLIPTKNRVEDMRMIKREDEIGFIRQAAKLTDECFDYVLGKLKIGITESEIAWELESFFKKRDAECAFSPIVAFGKNSSQPHYSFLQGVLLQKTDLVLLDFGARVNGYCADMTRVVFLGPPKEEWKKAYTAVLTAQQSALQAINDSLESIQVSRSTRLSGAAIDGLARGIIKNAGFVPYPHSLGHAVGLDIHESPRLTINPSAGSGRALKAGMVITVEPGVYIEGAYGIRIEDLVLLKESGIEVLSKSKKEIIIL